MYLINGANLNYFASSDTDSSELTDSVKAANAARSKIYLSIQRLLRTYWVLAVVGAFLLVTLTGEPSALKTVYLVCFFIFMITYQVRGVVTLMKLVLCACCMCMIKLWLDCMSFCMIMLLNISISVYASFKTISHTIKQHLRLFE